MTADKNLIKCNYCNKEFKYASEKRRHEKSHVPEFQCKVCSKNFSFISALRRHEKQHERIGTVKCDQCGKEFRDDILLKRHVKYAHGGLFTCTKCGSIFNSEPALRTHMQTHKSDSEKRYQCSFEGCYKKFNFSHHLKHHELTHSNTKQHYCKTCGKGFIQFHHLKAHLKTHNMDPSLHCSFIECNRKFATVFAKKRHVAKYHAKTDSGVSSDSNSSYDTPISTIIETSNTGYDHKMLAEKVLKKENEVVKTFFSGQELFNRFAENLCLSNTDYKENIIDNIEDVSNVSLSNCKSAVGDCIMEEENEKCVCEQITQPITDSYEFAPMETDNINFNALNMKSINNCQIKKCCGENDIIKVDMPEIKFMNDGTVKIKEFLNIDESRNDFFKENDGCKKNDIKFIPFNSCKSVLGNCIVSGNSTIGDGCLCAKMAMDDQVTAQEIDDITPHPEEDQTFFN